MSALATAVVCLPLLTAGGSVPRAELAELGGSLVEQRTLQRLLPSAPMSVRAFSEGTCVAETHTDSAGRYVLQMAPGTYWLQVLSGGEEVATERVSITTPGSWTWDIPLSAPPASPPAPLVARAASQGSEEGTGGAGSAGLEEEVSFLGPPVQVPLAPRPRSIPLWWSSRVHGDTPPVLPPWAPNS
jgi:hypothetical protein